MSAKQKASAEPASKKSGVSRLLIIAGLIVVVGGGGAAAYFTMRAPAATEEAEDRDTSEKHDQASATSKKKKKKKKKTESGLLSLEPFVVNLADPGGGRFLRVSTRLVLDSPEEAERIQKDAVLLVRVRSTILELLTQQKADELVTSEGKATLKTAIAEHLEPLLEEAEVEDVLFADFVVQF
jgi:flagellar protein FliL